jgi:glycerophosphoryl diester phosphodiesterase
MRLVLSVFLLMTAACGLVDAPGTPRIVAHGSGAEGPRDTTPTDVDAALSAGHEGLEVDVVLTSDGVPVLRHDPWLEGPDCTSATGVPLAKTFVESLSFEVLQRDYRCHGVPLMALSDFLARAGAHPGVLVHLDIKWCREGTPPPEAFAEAVTRALEGVPNPRYVTSPEPEVVRVFASRGLSARLTWPRTDPCNESFLPELDGELRGGALGLASARAAAREARADGVVLSARMAERPLVEALRDDGLAVGIFGVNTKAALSTFCRYPASELITDTPEEAPCR